MLCATTVVRTCYNLAMDSESVVLGGGCFWCTEAVFRALKGATSVMPGYTGGASAYPTYEQVSTGNTGHVEVINVEYDPDEISFEEILHVFFATHDPTTLNRQGGDVGAQYASAIFYTTPRQKEKAEHYIQALSHGAYAGPIVTKVAPLGSFYPAEDYHHNYFAKNRSAGYCQLVIAPKLDKVEEKFRHLLS